MARLNGFVGRRDLLRLVGLGGIGVAVTASGSVLGKIQSASAKEPVAGNQPEVKPVNADEALKRLMAGNQRFSQQKPIYPDQTLARLQEVSKGQHPFAAILSCSDSRVPAEIVFDQGLGDLFVNRIPGNVLNSEIIGSLEYATAVLGAQLIFVMGHENCGAVKEAVNGEPLPGRISAFVEPIKPAVARVRNKPGDKIDNAVIANIQYQVEILKQTSAIMSDLIKQGKLKVVGGRYDLDTGKVTIVP